MSSRGNNPLQLTVKYFDKALLGFALLWFAQVGLQCATAEAFEFDDWDRRVQKIEAYLNNKRSSKLAVPNWLEELSQKLSKADIGPMAEFPSWVMHNRPNLVFDFKLPDTPEFSHASTSPRVTVKRGELVVVWDEPEISSTLKLVSEKLQRLGRDGRWRDLLTIKHSENAPRIDRSFSDRQVMQNQDYRYRVLSQVTIDTDSPLVSVYMRRYAKTHGGQSYKLKADLAAKLSEVVKGRPKPMWQILPTHVRFLDPLQTKAAVHMTIRHWFAGQARTIRLLGAQTDSVLSAASGQDASLKFGKLISAQIERVDHPRIKNFKVNRYTILVKYEDGSEERFSSDQSLDDSEK